MFRAYMCQHGDLVCAHFLANMHIEAKLEELPDKATEQTACSTSLHNHLFRVTNQQTQTLSGSPAHDRPHRQCILKTREKHTTVITIEQWEERSLGEPYEAKARAFLSRWPKFTRLGITTPETVSLVPFHNQCVPDMCHLAWTPKTTPGVIYTWILCNAMTRPV